MFFGLQMAVMRKSASGSSAEAEKLEVTRATLIFDQENIFPLKDGVVCRITPTRRPDGNILYRASFERTGADGRTEILAAPAVVVLPASPFKIQIGDLGFGFTPKSG